MKRTNREHLQRSEVPAESRNYHFVNQDKGLNLSHELSGQGKREIFYLKCFRPFILPLWPTTPKLGKTSCPDGSWPYEKWWGQRPHSLRVVGKFVPTAPTLEASEAMSVASEDGWCHVQLDHSLFFPRIPANLEKKMQFFNAVETWNGRKLWGGRKPTGRENITKEDVEYSESLSISLWIR